MPSLILGSRGFIGSALLQYTKNYIEDEWIGVHRDNYEQWRGRWWDVLIWVAGQSSKVKCQSDPDACFEANYTQLLQAIHDFPARKIVYISSFDIYPLSGLEKDETYNSWRPGFYPSSFYGATKFSGELAIQSRGQDFIILRANGFTGPGLKKNVVYDIAGTRKIWVSWDSRFQYIHVDVFAHILFSLLNNYSAEIFNIAPPDIITPVQVANFLGRDIKDIQQPLDRIVPKIDAVLSVDKMVSVLKKLKIPIPSSEEAVRYWNVRYPFEIQMYKMPQRVG